MSGAASVLLFRKKNEFPAGLNRPIVVVPLESQSPTMGRSPGAPNDTVTSGGAEALLLRRKKRFPFGLKTPSVMVPLPSQSPTIGAEGYDYVRDSIGVAVSYKESGSGWPIDSDGPRSIPIPVSSDRNIASRSISK
jgi:hypothetical protein